MTGFVLRVLIPALLLVASAAAAAGDVVALTTDRVAIRIDTRGGLPRSWSVCAAPCDVAARRMVFLRDGQRDQSGGEFRWSGPDAVVTALATREFTAVTRETPAALTVELQAVADGTGTPVVLHYELSRLTHELLFRAQLPPGVGIRITPATDFEPPAQPGFGGVYARIGRIVLGDWCGIRSHFWAWLGRAENPGSGSALVPPAGASASLIWQATAGGPLALRFYAGPIEWRSLRVVAPELSGLLFAGLWTPLRWLAFGLFFLLAALSRVIAPAGVAIIALSLCVKIILYPLTRIAERWQAGVNRIQARIVPQVAAIRRDFRGEEAHRRTLAVYREAGVSPWFTVRSLAGFAIQVPMFIAAFDMLADNFALSGAAFLWIGDLAAPDRFAPLPFTMPFFGAHLNLLPVLMTLLTVLSAIVQQDAHLTPELLHRQRRQLLLMAALFFVLFYTFPAGMVLYWTANNGWHLVKLLAGRWLAARNAAGASP